MNFAISITASASYLLFYYEVVYTVAKRYLLKISFIKSHCIFEKHWNTKAFVNGSYSFTRVFALIKTTLRPIRLASRKILNQPQKMLSILQSNSFYIHIWWWWRSVELNCQWLWNFGINIQQNKMFICNFFILWMIIDR